MYTFSFGKAVLACAKTIGYIPVNISACFILNGRGNNAMNSVEKERLGVHFLY